MKHIHKGFIVIGLSYFLLTSALIAGAITLDQHATDDQANHVAQTSPTATEVLH